MPSYTFTGLTPGRTASVFREGGGANPRTAVTSGLVAGDSTLTVTLDTGNYRAEDGSRVAYAAQADDSTTQQADTAAASGTSSTLVHDGAAWPARPAGTSQTWVGPLAAGRPAAAQATDLVFLYTP